METNIATHICCLFTRFLFAPADNLQFFSQLKEIYKFFSPVKIERKDMTENVVFIGLVPRLPPKEISSLLSSQMNLPGSENRKYKFYIYIHCRFCLNERDPIKILSSLNALNLEIDRKRHFKLS